MEDSIDAIGTCGLGNASDTKDAERSQYSKQATSASAIGIVEVAFGNSVFASGEIIDIVVRPNQISVPAIQERVQDRRSFEWSQVLHQRYAECPLAQLAREFEDYSMNIGLTETIDRFLGIADQIDSILA